MATTENRMDYPGGGVARLHSRPTLIPYEQVERDVYMLAAKLVDSFGQSAVQLFHFTSIPRGGVFVLGILSYILDLSPQQLAVDRDSSEPLVVVDDCSLSGARFAQFLAEVDHRPVIFAPLFSHPDLRAAILAQEDDVLACVSARDLVDLAPEHYPDPEAYGEWRRQWLDRIKGKLYWIGQPELVIFPWNEPDRPIWNPETEQVEDNWRLTSPDRCLKNWGKLGLPPRLGTKAVVRIPDGVAYAARSNHITLYNTANETVYGLEDAAADIWRGLAAYGDLTATKEYLLELYDVEEARLTADIQSLVETLLEKGLLEPVDDLPSA